MKTDASGHKGSLKDLLTGIFGAACNLLQGALYFLFQDSENERMITNLELDWGEGMFKRLPMSTFITN